MLLRDWQGAYGEKEQSKSSRKLMSAAKTRSSMAAGRWLRFEFTREYGEEALGICDDA
jgi:hypothetical protein